MNPQFPEIDYLHFFEESERHPWTSSSSCKAGVTRHQNLGLIPKNITSDVIVPSILAKIEKYKNDGAIKALKTIFFQIQAWGGKSARQYAEILDENWNYNKHHYQTAVGFILKGQYNLGLRHLIDNVYGLNVSFATKHLHFWTTRRLPILDTIIGDVLYPGILLKSINYEEYVGAMDAHAKIVAASIRNRLFSRNKTRNLEAAIFLYGFHSKEKRNSLTPKRKKVSNKPKKVSATKDYISLIPQEFEGSKSKYLQCLLQSSSRANVSRAVKQMGIPLRYSELINAENQLQKLSK